MHMFHTCVFHSFLTLTLLLKDGKFEALGGRVNRSLTSTQVFQD